MGYNLLLTVTRREYGETFAEFFSRDGGAVMYSPCIGTAQQKTLDLLGLERTEKAMFFAVLSSEKTKTALHEMVYRLNIDAPGNGIALTVPLNSFGGMSSKEYLTGNAETEAKKLQEREEYRYSLIFAIAEKGSSETVMDAARLADARGGTVLHVKGTGRENAAKFLGITVADEKEMILIVAKKDNKNEIMQAINENAGPDTPAKTVLFSVPVENVVGLRSLTEGEPVQI